MLVCFSILERPTKISKTKHVQTRNLKKNNAATTPAVSLQQQRDESSKTSSRGIGDATTTTPAANNNNKLSVVLPGSPLQAPAIVSPEVLPLPPPYGMIDSTPMSGVIGSYKTPAKKVCLFR